MPRPVLTIEPPYTPEMLRDAYKHIETLLSPDSQVFEFGSGYSTVWLAQYAGRVVYVEHDSEWAAETERALREARVTSKAKGVLVEDEGDIGPTIDRYGDFDLVLVDCLDRQRVSAVQHAVAHVRPGGYLVLDDSQWSMLSPARLLLDGLGWEPLTFRGEHTRKNGDVRHHRTTIYRHVPLDAGDEEE